MHFEPLVYKLSSFFVDLLNLFICVSSIHLRLLLLCVSISANYLAYYQCVCASSSAGGTHKSVPTTPNDLKPSSAYDPVTSSMAALHLSPRAENPTTTRFLYHSNNNSSSSNSNAPSSPSAHSSESSSTAVCIRFQFVFL